MSVVDGMFWNMNAKTKQVGNGVRVTIPGHTNLWNPRSQKEGIKEAAPPYLFRKVTGDFEISVKLHGHFDFTYDQAGILVKESEKSYMYCGIEVGHKPDIVLQESLEQERVRTIATSVVNGDDRMDWSCMPFYLLKESEKSKEHSYWFRMKRVGNTFTGYFSVDDGATYRPVRCVNCDYDKKVSVGVYGACVWGKELRVTFEEIKITEGRPSFSEFGR